MSNLSDIGFPVQSEQDVNVLITETINYVESIKCAHGFYLRFADASGAEIYLQGNLNQELVGFNPHFDGRSKRLVGLTKAIERDSSPLDGGFYAWANPKDKDVETSGEYPFVFDVPDFRTIEQIDFPKTCEIQLTAFASNDFKIFADEKEYDKNQTGELKYASKSFVPVGLFNSDGENWDELNPPRPVGQLAGEIRAFELKTNELSKENFYWFLVETLGGEVDVVADAKLISVEPKVGGVVSGQFWLSGRIVDTAEPIQITKNVF
ncbi:MAG: hypothetical protein H0U87_04595 [Acidobacteria bacterium]|jgi:hypothetical protein|nr:hypothetical protein [Acidobacteriota bacterium]